MKKLLTVIILTLLFMFSGCAVDAAPDLNEENIEPVVASQASQPPEDTHDIQVQVIEQSDSQSDLAQKMAAIGFDFVSGYYTRKAIEDEGEYIEMFSFEKNTFIRITTNDLDREVFAYNYKSDDFTYIYYFDGVMTAKTVLNVGTGAVLEDEGGYAEVLSKSADELKGYFKDLLEAAELSSDELHY